MRGLLLVGLLLGVQGALAATIQETYGVCPKYRVKEGDTLWNIAQKVGTDVAALEAAAKACEQNTTNIQLDQLLCLPGYISSRCKDVLQTDPDRPYCQVYRVAAGDTVASVADKFGMKEKELSTLNSDYLAKAPGGKPATGQYIRLAGWDQVQCRDFNDNDRPKCQVYTVQPGDQLSGLATLYKVDLAEMLALNNLSEADPLQLNTRLKLPKWDATCSADGVPAVLPADTVRCRVTQLQDGDNLSVLAQRYGSTVKALLDANPELSDPTKLQPGAYINLAPFPADCVGQGKLVDVAGETVVPADFTYNGLQPSSVVMPEPAAPAVVPDDVAAPEAAPSAAPTPAPAAAAPVAAPVPAPAPAPEATPIEVTDGAASAAGSALLAAALAVAAALAL